MTPAPFVQSSSSSSLLAITSFSSFVTSLSSRCKPKKRIYSDNHNLCANYPMETRLEHAAAY